MRLKKVLNKKRVHFQVGVEERKTVQRDVKTAVKKASEACKDKIEVWLQLFGELKNVFCKRFKLCLQLF